MGFRTMLVTSFIYFIVWDMFFISFLFMRKIWKFSKIEVGVVGFSCVHRKGGVPQKVRYDIGHCVLEFILGEEIDMRIFSLL